MTLEVKKRRRYVVVEATTHGRLCCCHEDGINKVRSAGRKRREKKERIKETSNSQASRKNHSKRVLV